MNRMVELAKQYLGFNESDGTYKCFIKTYNSQPNLPRGYKVKNSDPWCAIFVSALAIEAGLTDIIPTECSCEEMLKRFKEMGCFVEEDAYLPRVGDIIFYDWQDNGKGDNQGWSDHVGIIEKITDKQISVIEGNKGNAVGRRYIKPNAQYIRGFGVPNYSEEDRPDLTPPPELADKIEQIPGTIKADPKSVEQLAQEVLRGEWGNDPERKNKLTLSYGADTAKAVQDRVNEIIKEKNLPAEKYGTVRVNTCLRVRRDPVITNTNILGTIGNGTKVRIEETKNGWYRISSPREGWVSSQYVEV